jgi:hypothetical protein
MEPAAKNIRNPWTQAFELPVSVVSNVNLDTSPCFVLAEQILCGETKVSKKQRAAADDYVETARSVALVNKHCGLALLLNCLIKLVVYRIGYNSEILNYGHMKVDSRIVTTCSQKVRELHESKIPVHSSYRGHA